MVKKQRRSMSNLIATVMLIGVSAAIGGAVLVFGTEFTESAFQTGPIDIKSLTIKNSGSASYVSAIVRNTNDETLKDMKIILYVGASTLNDVLFSQTSVGIGSEASTTTLVTNGTNPHYLPIGTKVLVEIEATDSTGTIKAEPRSIRVS